MLSYCLALPGFLHWQYWQSHLREKNHLIWSGFLKNLHCTKCIYIYISCLELLNVHPFPGLTFRNHPWLKLALGASWSSWITSQGYNVATLSALELPQATVAKCCTRLVTGIRQIMCINVSESMERFGLSLILFHFACSMTKGKEHVQSKWARCLSCDLHVPQQLLKIHVVLPLIVTILNCT